jgi:hypothetical protein
MCDDGHAWSITEVAEGVEPEPGTCLDGHPAVTGRREPWADRLSFTLLPMARVADAATSSIVDEGLLELRLVGPDGADELVGGRPYSLDEARSRMAELAGVTAEEGVLRAKRIGFVSRT